MQRFRASITFWTMSLLVETSEIQYHLLRGYTSSSADGDSVGHTALLDTALGHSFRLRLINWHVAATLPVAEVNLCPLPILTGCKKKKVTVPSGILLSAFGMWLLEYPAHQPGAPVCDAKPHPWLPLIAAAEASFSGVVLRSLDWTSLELAPIDSLLPPYWREQTAGQNAPGDSDGKLSVAQTLFLECCYFQMS